MSFLERALKKGISKGIGDAIGRAVQQVVEPKATEFANRAAQKLDQAAQTSTRQAARTSNELEGAFANLQRAMEDCVEQASPAAGSTDVMSQWRSKLPQYPVWCCGGEDYEIEEFDGACYFTAYFGSSAAARNAVDRYREVLMQSGFRPAGENPNRDNLYKMVDGRCYHADLEHCFDADSTSPTVGFAIGEPRGGFSCKKPESGKSSWRDLF